MVWGGLLRIFLYQHATFSVNSICHMFGRKDYRSRDEARNNWLVALLVFGEGWHNNHHAFPSSARHGLHRRQFDVSWWVIRGLERLGLVWNVRQPTEVQLERRRLPSPGTASRRLPKPRPRRAVLVWARSSSAATSSAQRPARGSGIGRPQCARSGDPVERRRESACSCRRRHGPERARSRGASSPARRPGSRAGSGRARRGGRPAARPSRPERSRRSGIQGASPITSDTDACRAAPIATAPPIENPRRMHRSAPALETASRAAQRVLDAHLHAVPGLHAVANLGEGDGREPGREPADEPLERGAPGALDRTGLAAVHADDRQFAHRVRDAHLGARREPLVSGRAQISPPRGFATVSRLKLDTTYLRAVRPKPRNGSGTKGQSARLESMATSGLRTCRES